MVGSVLVVFCALFRAVSLAPAAEDLYKGFSKQNVLNSFSKVEKKLVFGDDSNPEFEIVFPGWTSAFDQGIITKFKTLKIEGESLKLNTNLQESNQFLSSSIAYRSLNNDGSRMNCHWRFLNSTIVITVDECFPKGIHALILRKNNIQVLYPIDMDKLHIKEQDSRGYPHILYRGNAKRNIKFSKEGSVENIARKSNANAAESDGSVSADFKHDLIDLESDLERFRIHQVSEPLILNVSEIERNPGEIEIKLRKTVEIAIFCDSSLTQSFIPNSSQITLRKYVEILVNALEGIYHQEELGGYIIDLKLVHVRFLKKGEGPHTSNGDIANYLRAFSSWQMSQNIADDSNPDHWDHAIMLSGLDLTSGGVSGIIGLAWVNGMCDPRFSSTMNEGGTFLSLFVVAHEMGHNLGMDHDGSQSFAACDATSHIMSPSVGPGKTTWSPCSAQVVRRFLGKRTCLSDGSETHLPSNTPFSTMPQTSSSSPDIECIKRKLPGQIFPPEKQCQLAHGANAIPASLHGRDICYFLYCSKEGFTRRAHPALEGSDCGNGNICIAGSCKDESELLRLILLFLDVFQKVDELYLREIRSEILKNNEDSSFDKLTKLNPSLSSSALENPENEPANGDAELPNWDISGYERRVIKGPCSVSCGRGVRALTVDCFSFVDGFKQEPHLCGMTEHSTTSYEECLMRNCFPPSWIANPWSSCNVTCGFGVQYRDVFCGIITEEDTKEFFSPTVLDPSSCNDYYHPIAQRTCFVDCQG